MKPLVVLDTPALYYRAFYSVPDSIVNDDGIPVNAVRGVLDTVAQMIRRFATDRVIAAMDGDWRPEFRTAIMPEYKAARIKDEDAGTEIPPELAAQLPILNRVLAAAGIPIAEVAGTEADDIIATMAAQSTTSMVIVSPDRDLLALLDSNRDISVLRPRKGGEWESISEADLPEKYGVPDGRRYRELAALRGDPSDGLPGAPGIGEKTAATLLESFGSLAWIITAAKAGVKTGGLSQKRAQSIVENEETLLKTVEVMTCLSDVDHGIDLDGFGTRTNRAMVREAAANQNIARSVDNLLEALGEFGQTGSSWDSTAHTSVDASTTSPTAVSENSTVAGGWAQSRLVGFDLETTGVDPATARIVTAALVEADGSSSTWLADPGIEIPESARAIHGITTEFAQANGIPSAEVVTQLCAALAEFNALGTVLVGHNIVYDLSVLSAEIKRHRPDVDLTAILPNVIDTMVLDKKVEPIRRGKRTLGDVAVRWGVKLLDAHDATADALAALEIARALAQSSTEIASLTGAEIMSAQGEWKRAQAADLQDWLRRKRDPDAVVDGSWPLA